MIYTDSTQDLTAEKVQGFFVGWPNPPSPQTLVDVLRNSDQVVLAIDEGTADVVGFVTALTDGILCAYLSLLEVLPPYQGRGIGRELVRRMLAKLSHLYAIDLLCDPELQPFYAKLGMRPAHGMLIRHYEWQSGNLSALERTERLNRA